VLRRSCREHGKVKHENLGNLSHLPDSMIEVLRRALAGEVLISASDALQVERSLPHGHVAAVLGVLRDLDLERLLGRERCPERGLVVALICQRLIAPGQNCRPPAASLRRRWVNFWSRGVLRLRSARERWSVSTRWPNTSS
jgi:hypothetical protein